MIRRSSVLKSLFLMCLLTALVSGQETVSKVNGSAKDAKSAAKPAPVTIEKIESDMAEALSIIQENYVDRTSINYNDLFKSSIDSMLHTLDPHSNYYDAKEFEQFRTDQSSQYFGIGASIGDIRDPKGNVRGTIIKATFENAPAHRAGLRYGDMILDVNGTSMIGKTFPEVRNFLRGPRGTSAKITVEKYRTGVKETVDIVRDAVPQPSIPEAYMIRPGVGYIAMTGGFNQTTFAEFRQSLAQLKAQGMNQLVLDLRNNGGGLVRQAYQVANAFLSRGQEVFTQKGRLDGVGDTYRAENANPEKAPLVILINQNSASASEILAGALQDHDRALIVGENSFGKGLVQNPFVLQYGSMLLLTIAKYETPSGRLIQRDYSNGDLYNYYNKQEGVEQPKTDSKPPESKTDSGRPVYSGGGIMPDEVVPFSTITVERFRQQQRLLDPVLVFSMDVVHGKRPDFSAYKVDRPITFDYDLKTTDLVVNEAMFQAFRKFAVETYKLPAALVDKERQFIERNLRTEFSIAAYGMTTALQVSNEFDNQLLKAIELLPKARLLALEGERAKSNPPRKAN